VPGVARQTDKHEGTCDHGASCCPHKVTGEIITASSDYFVNGLGAARLYDKVEHNCPHNCGTGEITTASATVIVNGRGVAREGDEVTYPGGKGKIVTASGNVFAGG